MALVITMIVYKSLMTIPFNIDMHLQASNYILHDSATTNLKQFKGRQQVQMFLEEPLQ